MKTARCYLNTLGMLCASGDSVAAIQENIFAGKTHLSTSDAFGNGQPLTLGLYQGELPDVSLPQSKWHSRNNQFALAVLEQIKEQVSDAIRCYGASRVGVIIGTSTSGIAESEEAIRQYLHDGEIQGDYDYSVQEMGSTAQFVAEVLGVAGPVFAISTACTSGAKALAAARRMIRAGICDAVIAGGIDTLCQLTVRGFSSLEAVSAKLCNPFSRNRSGINIGEAAALFLITTEARGVELTGVGEGSDAHHISAPDPSGAGAVRCMAGALSDAGLDASDIGYVNLHGTATPLNDEMESLAIENVFGLDTLCSSTKPFTGHTLGAAGAVEAGICWLTLQHDTRGFLPVHVWDGQRDPQLPGIKLVEAGSRIEQSPDYVLSNNFAFGGSNISLVLGRIQ